MRLLLTILLAFLATVARGADVIDATRRVDFTRDTAGVPGGIPDSSLLTVYQTLGSTATLAQVRSAAIAAGSNQVVKLLAGSYSWSGEWDGIGTTDGVIVSGSVDANGKPTTIVTGDVLFRLRRHDYNSGAYITPDVNLAEDAAQGDTNLVVTAIPSWVKPNVWLAIDQLDNGGIISTNAGHEGADVYRSQGILGDTGEYRGLSQSILVLATNGTDIHIWPPLAYDFTTSATSQVYQAGHNTALAGGGMLNRVGFENIIFIHPNTGPESDHDLFVFEGARECWLKNIEATNLLGGVYALFYFSTQCEISHCRFDDSQALGGGQGYGVAFYHWSACNLVENTIFTELHVAMQNNYGSSHNVFFANFEINGQSDADQNPAFNTHGSTGHNALLEASWCMDKVNGDFVHGPGSRATIFRNRVVGKNPDQINDQEAVSIESWSRGYNVVANMLGDDSFHTNYSAGFDVAGDYWLNDCVDASKSIFNLGFWSNFGCNTANNGDSFSLHDCFIALNYDTVTTTNGGVVWGGKDPADLVDSYVYPGGAPDWWGADQPWPPYGPDVTADDASMSYTNIPAGYRYAFNADPETEGGGGDPPGSTRPALFGPPSAPLFLRGPTYDGPWTDQDIARPERVWTLLVKNSTAGPVPLMSVLEYPHPDFDWDLGVTVFRKFNEEPMTYWLEEDP